MAQSSVLCLIAEGAGGGPHRQEACAKGSPGLSTFQKFVGQDGECFRTGPRRLRPRGALVGWKRRAGWGQRPTPSMHRTVFGWAAGTSSARTRGGRSTCCRPGLFGASRRWGRHCGQAYGTRRKSVRCRSSCSSLWAWGRPDRSVVMRSWKGLWGPMSRDEKLGVSCWIYCALMF